MRRTTLMSAAASAALLVAVPSAVATASDHVSPVRDSIEALRLECRARVTDRGPVVRCDWTAPTVPSAAAIQLYRLDPAVDEHRRVVYRSENVVETGFTDTHVRPGHEYVYAVVALNENGRIVARSRAERVSVPGDRVEALRLRCKLGPAADAIGCEWSRPQSEAASVVSLWRSVDGGPRELVERFRPTGPNAYRDRVPANASRVTYVVIATSESAELVARSRPSTVRIPATDVQITDRARPERVTP